MAERPTDDGRTAGDHRETADDRATTDHRETADDHIGVDDDAPSATTELRALALASFHVATLVAVGVGLLHAGSLVGDLLSGLGTLPGVALYLLLWLLTWRTNRRWLLAHGPPGWDAVRPALTWGAVTGVGFLLGVLAALAVVLEPADLVVLVIFAGVGAPVAAVVGALVGGVFALVDAALDAVADAVVPTREST
jgi:hypothetical protein